MSDLVCVLCGRPWVPTFKNVCECGGFCSWGEAKGGSPSSWLVRDDGSWALKPTPRELGGDPEVDAHTGWLTICCPHCGFRQYDQSDPLWSQHHGRGYDEWECPLCYKPVQTTFARSS